MHRRTTRYHRIGVVLLGLWLALLPSICAQAADLVEPQRILLSWTGDTATTMTISWQDGESVTQGMVQYSLEKEAQTPLTQEAVLTPAESGISNGASRWEATLTGLTPGATYYYRVGRPDHWSGTATFTTSSLQGNSTTFMYMGDIQVVANAASEYAAWGQLAEGALSRHPDLQFGLLGGDMVDSGIRTEQWDLFLDAASATFSKLPLMPTNGNHESNFVGTGKPELYLDLFSLPQNGVEGFEEEIYSFEVGNCHVTVLNSWIFSGEQKITEEQLSAIDRWLAQDLATSAGRWNIVMTHLPLYPVHADATASRAAERWLPILEQCGADLLLVGHQHVYARSYPLYQGSIDPQRGLLSIMGVSGEKFYSSADETKMERTIYNTATYQILRAEEKSLSVETFDGSGTLLDQCAIAPKALQPLSRADLIALLWQLDGSPAVAVPTLFSDINEGDAYAKAAAWAVEHQVISGTGGGRLTPEGDATTEQLLAMLWRQAGAPAVSIPPIRPCASWAEPAVAWGEARGLLDGFEGTLSNPITRAEASRMIRTLLVGD